MDKGVKIKRHGCSIEKMRSIGSVISLGLLFLSYSFFSYFGAPNPVLTGLASGLSVTFLGLMIGLILACAGRGWFIAYLFIFWILANGLIIANWWYFQFFRAYFNYEILRLGADSLEAVRSFSAFQYKKESLQLLAVTGAFSIYSICFYKKYNFRSSGVYVLKLICLIAGIVGIVFVDDVLANTRLKNSFLLSPKYLHPVHAFVTKTDVKQDQKELLPSWQYYKNQNTLIESSSDSVTIDWSGVENKSKKYNVITIVMESFRASLTGYYGDEKGLTPNFDKLARTFISAENFYANTNYTVKAETSIYCGLFD